MGWNTRLFAATAAMLGVGVLAEGVALAQTQPRTTQTTPFRRPAPAAQGRPVAQPQVQVRPAAGVAARPRKIRSARFECRAACRRVRRACIRRNYHGDACGTQANQCYRSCTQKFPRTQYAPGFPMGR